METNQPSNMNNSYDSQLINIRQEDTSVNMKTSVNVSKSNNKEQILNAIYRSVVDVDGSVIAGAQNYGRILRFK